VLRARRLRRSRELREVWPDAIDNLASGVRAGLSLPEAVAGLAERGPQPLRAPLARFADDYHATGRFGAALDRLKDELADPTADRVVEALRLAREVGGSELGRTLRILSTFLRDELRVRKELEARQTWVLVAARMAFVTPWLALLLLATKPEAVAAYRGGGGAVVLAVGVVHGASGVGEPGGWGGGGGGRRGGCWGVVCQRGAGGSGGGGAGAGDGRVLPGGVVGGLGGGGGGGAVGVGGCRAWWPGGDGGGGGAGAGGVAAAAGGGAAADGGSGGGDGAAAGAVRRWGRHRGRGGGWPAR